MVCDNRSWQSQVCGAPSFSSAPDGGAVLDGRVAAREPPLDGQRSASDLDLCFSFSQTLDSRLFLSFLGVAAHFHDVERNAE